MIRPELTESASGINTVAGSWRAALDGNIAPLFGAVAGAAFRLLV
jgi:hypothetical protein